MIRTYNDGIKGKEVKYFIGKEVEKTSCFGQLTLFIAEYLLTPEEVVELALEHNCTNIYLGANKSKCTIAYMEDVLTEAKAHYLNVTFDLSLQDFLNVRKVLPQSPRLHLNVSIEVPNIHCNMNVNFKIDDIDFNKTNPGVWILNMNSAYGNFTGWEEYKDDVTL